MAIYHYEAQLIQRSKGQSAVAAAAYRAGAKLHDERLGLTHDYSRKRAVAFAEILAPIEAPGWVHDRVQLWNQVESAENRCDSQSAREINVALPHELTLEQCQQLLREFVQEQFVERGMIADVVIHDLPHNRHAHLMLTTRLLVGEGFGLKNRDWNKKEFLDAQREAWADHTNRVLEQAGHSARIDHRSLEDQGIEDRLPQIHLGANVVAMKEKAEQKGEVFEHPRWERYQEIERINAEMRQLDQEIEIEKERLGVIEAGVVAPGEEPALLETQNVEAAPILPVVEPDTSPLVEKSDIPKYQRFLETFYALWNTHGKRQPRCDGNRYWIESVQDSGEVRVGKQGNTAPFLRGQWDAETQTWKVLQAEIALDDQKYLQAMRVVWEDERKKQSPPRPQGPDLAL